MVRLNKKTNELNLVDILFLLLVLALSHSRKRSPHRVGPTKCCAAKSLFPSIKSIALIKTELWCLIFL